MEQRSGTLWEGRFKASLIHSEDYLLACYRYVALNPVRTLMVKLPEDYPWSSYHSHAGSSDTTSVDPSDAYVALGINAGARCRAYRS
jgi:putative transposase